VSTSIEPHPTPLPGLPIAHGLNFEPGRQKYSDGSVTRSQRARRDVVIQLTMFDGFKKVGPRYGEHRSRSREAPPA